jgi:iron-sulfur cluster insertion protein
MGDITIQQEAAEQIDKILSEEEQRPYALRIFVVGGGCSGFEYGFSLELNGKQDDDLEFETNGIKMVCDYMSMQYLNGAIIGWNSTIAGSNFSIKNPNATATCGCGSSFAA